MTPTQMAALVKLSGALRAASEAVLDFVEQQKEQSGELVPETIVPSDIDRARAVRRLRELGVSVRK